MKSARQNAILELIASGTVATQEELASLLLAKGYQVTQATVSRDIRELRLIKTLSSDGGYYYSVPEKAGEIANNERLVRMFSSTVLKIDSAYNQIIIKTLSGSANAAAETIDSLQIPEILGTIAGDNTILLIAKSVEAVPPILSRLNGLIEG